MRTRLSLFLLPLLGALALIVWHPDLSNAANSPPAIPVGTRITLENWQQYKDYMSEGMQMMFRGTTKWKVPPGYYLEIGPTTHFPLPKKYRADTEQYSSQVKLIQLPNGSYLPQGYVAGQPFPNPTQPDLGEKLFYNYYYRYIPWVEASQHSTAALTDRFDNVYTSEGLGVDMRLAHISDVGMPVTHPQGNGYYTTLMGMTLTPEQAKYTSILNILMDDPTKIDEHYIFVPSIRRVTRLSAAARCAPLGSGDFTNDDGHGSSVQADTVTATYVREQKLLAVMNLNNPENANGFLFPSRLPKPENGKWEVRDVWVVDIKRLPSESAGYCYSNRRLYIDKEISNILQTDLYDSSGKLWKLFMPSFKPHVIPGTNGDIEVGNLCGTWLIMYDFEIDHSTMSYYAKCEVNDEVPVKYRDPTQYASPGGLDQILQ